jgi:hypothetical protein
VRSPPEPNGDVDVAKSIGLDFRSLLSRADLVDARLVSARMITFYAVEQTLGRCADALPDVIHLVLFQSKAKVELPE